MGKIETIELCEKCNAPEDRWSTCTHPGCPQDQEYFEHQAEPEDRYANNDPA